MKTMKKIIALSTVAMCAFSFMAFAQNKKPADDKGKMHIKIEVEKDGKTTKVDTTLNPEDLAAFNEKMREQGIYVGTLEGLPDANGFAFATDEERLQEEMKKLEEHMKNNEFDANALEEHMRVLEKEMNDSTLMFKYKIKTDADSGESMIELENELGNMNFNFSDDDGVKTITIDGDNINIDGNNIKIDDDKGEKKIIIKKDSKKDGKQK